MTSGLFRAGDPVTIDHAKFQGRFGFIAHIGAKKAVVVLSDKTEWNIPLSVLKIRTGVAPRLVRTRGDCVRLSLQINDFVTFSDRSNKQKEGRVLRLNREGAVVRCDGTEWKVPYLKLKIPSDRIANSTPISRLDKVEHQAKHLLAKHGLLDWRIYFDQATRRVGKCNFETKQISLSEQFVLVSEDAEITDSILHEIAHALVGPQHGHDSTWKNTAMRIGCSGAVTFRGEFSSAPWFLTCEVCGWKVPRAYRHNVAKVCLSCGEKVKYVANVDQPS